MFAGDWTKDLDLKLDLIGGRVVQPEWSGASTAVVRRKVTFNQLATRRVRLLQGSSRRTQVNVIFLSRAIESCGIPEHCLPEGWKESKDTTTF